MMTRRSFMLLAMGMLAEVLIVWLMDPRASDEISLPAVLPFALAPGQVLYLPVFVEG